MQMVEEVSHGSVTIGPGTLYGAFATLEKERMIEMVREEGRRKVYRLTGFGQEVLSAQMDRLRQVVALGDQMHKMSEE
ncbi:MAG: helix-turn-helix transcriptional regulator [Anaerolineaceae bacterium]|nr:helix-turn-helix transcriptional regulator [Anaerolineaceae bacterium]